MDSDSDDQLAEIQAQVDEWSTNSTECVTLHLSSSGGGGNTNLTFEPAFTYPIFGEEEAIFGYKDLRIDITFAAHDLRPRLAITHSQVFKAQGEVEATDILGALSDFLPEGTYNEGELNGNGEDVVGHADAVGFRPPGEKIYGYEREGQEFEVWCASLADPLAKRILENMQILVPMFIEGGTTLQLEDDWMTKRWKLFLLYKVDPEVAATGSPYFLVGYGTSYRVFTLPDRQKPLQHDLDLFSSHQQSLDSILPPLNSDATQTSNPPTPLDLPSRERLSQFLILPPFQHSTHGQTLYNAMYTHLTSPPNIRELTVEDPNEAFDDLRDVCDLRRLRAHNGGFASLRINADIPAASLAANATIPTDLIVDGVVRERVQRETKIMPRQFDRLVEMHTLSFIPSAHRSRSRLTRKERSSNKFDRAYYLWRLFAKQRLYVHNRDQLVQVERGERGEKLEAALDGVVEGYVGVLERVERMESLGGGKDEGEGMGGVRGGAEEGRVRKRKVLSFVGEDDEDEEEGEGEAVVVNGHKKVRVL